MLSRWPLFGSSFFAVKRVSAPKERADHILALNRQGVHFIDIVTHVSTPAPTTALTGARRANGS